MTISALKPLVGRWTTTIVMISPADLAGQTYRAIDTYRWMPGEKVLVHEVEARMGGDPVHSLEIYTEHAGRIVSRSFDSGGEVSDFTAEMKDGVWTLAGDTQRFKSTRIETDVIEGLWRLKTGEVWADWMTVRLDRIA